MPRTRLARRPCSTGRGRPRTGRSSWMPLCISVCCRRCDNRIALVEVISGPRIYQWFVPRIPPFEVRCEKCGASLTYRYRHVIVFEAPPLRTSTRTLLSDTSELASQGLAYGSFIRGLGSQLPMLSDRGSAHSGRPPSIHLRLASGLDCARPVRAPFRSVTPTPDCWRAT